MKIPGFGKPQNDNPYIIPQPGEDNKKTTFMMFGGLGLLVILLFIVLTSGGSPAGSTDLKSAVQQTSDAIGVVNEYDKHIKGQSAQNDIAQIKIILTGNYNKLIALYKDSYDPKASFSGAPKPDGASIKTLDSAVKNDTVDSEIVSVLKPKIILIRKSLIVSKPNFKSDNLRVITNAQADYQSISDILEKQN